MGEGLDGFLNNLTTLYIVLGEGSPRAASPLKSSGQVFSYVGFDFLAILR